MHSLVKWVDRNLRFLNFCLQVMSFAMSISWTVYARLGGALDAPLPYSSTVKIIFISWLSQTWCITAIVTTKISIAALIKRLQAPSKWRTVVLWSLCSVSAAWALIQIGFVWGQCRPTATLWDPRGHSNGSCWSPTVVVYNGMACSCSSSPSIVPHQSIDADLSQPSGRSRTLLWLSYRSIWS